MNRIYRWAIGLQIWRDRQGQDLIEYAMIAAFLAASCSVLFPDFPKNMSMIISKISSTWAARG